MINKKTFFITICIATAIFVTLYIYDNKQKEKSHNTNKEKNLINTKTYKKSPNTNIHYTNSKETPSIKILKPQTPPTSTTITNKKYIQYRQDKHTKQQNQIKKYINMRKNQELIDKENIRNMNIKNSQEAKKKELENIYKSNSINKKQLKYQNIKRKINHKNNLDKEMSAIIKRKIESQLSP